MTQDRSIKAIETRYAGCRFRSRLEARWAVFFDTIGIKWEYEPQGFMVGQTPYLPDFWLPDVKHWVEVKGDPKELNQGLLSAFVEQIDGSMLVLGSMPAPGVGPGDWTWSQLVGFPPDQYSDFDGSTSVFRVHFAKEDRLRLPMSDIVDRMDLSSGAYTFEGSETEWLEPLWDVQAWWAPARRAYEAARSARFEHGERGRA